jgi:ABC-2 type transport system ATP-binding protein
VDLEVEPGGVLAVLGQNGAGKTTLVKLLLGVQIPTAGRVEIFGQRMTPNAGLLRQRIGYVPAIPRFPPGMTPLDYLEFVGKLQGLVRRNRRPRIANLLRAADLQRSSGTQIRLLSTGMRSRLAIAASLISNPDVMIWDEPSQGLDSDARRSMIALLQQLAEEKTLVLCSHNLSDIQQLCSQALVLHEGQVVYNGGLDALKTKPQSIDLDIDLSGEKKDIADAVKAIGQTEDINKCELQKTRLHLQLDPSASLTTVLVNVFVLLQDKSVDITDFKLSGGQTEFAIANLLREEGRRGLTRAYQSARR